MSSRLILLPKKSYTPWNAANVARVERDEQEARRKEEKAKEEERQRQSHVRMKALRQADHSNECDNRYTEKHVNLFEQEEEQAAKDVCQGKKSDGTKSGFFNLDFLGGSELRRRRGDPKVDDSNGVNDPSKREAIFYGGKFMTSRNSSSNSKKRCYDQSSGGQIEAELKQQMDPMKQFQRNERNTVEIPNDKKGYGYENDSSRKGKKSIGGREKESKKGKKCKSRKHLKYSSSSEKDIIDDMRRRRLERERNEKRREEDCIHKNNACSDHIKNTWRYTNQYNPRLSRR